MMLPVPIQTVVYLSSFLYSFHIALSFSLSFSRTLGEADIFMNGPCLPQKFSAFFCQKHFSMQLAALIAMYTALYDVAYKQPHDQMGMQ